MKQRSPKPHTATFSNDELSQAHSLDKEHRYQEEATILMRILDRIDPSSTEEAETRADATCALAALLRELYLPEAVPAIAKQLGGVPWPEEFVTERFRTLQAFGWWYGLQGDYFNAFRSLKRAAAIAPDAVHSTIAAADRAYLAKAIGEPRWSRQELDDAEHFATKADWNKAGAEERLTLLTLVELFSQVDASKSTYYLTRWRDLGESDSQESEPVRACIDYANALVAFSRGEQREGLRLLHASLDVFNRIGYDWRAGRCLIRIYEATRNSHMLGMAREKLRNYPSSWLSDEIQKLARENIGARTILPPMQQRVFEALCEGLSTIEIAERLGRSPFTVRNHIKEIFKAFNVTSRSALVAEAARRSLI